MVIGDSLGYTALGFGGGSVPRNHLQAERNSVVLEAKLDPKKPNEYSVQTSAPVIAPPEKTSESKNTGRQFPQNTDPASRAFNAIANYEPRAHKIDIHV
ncbi:MAG: hypothetical protein AAGC78_12015 [Cellvibrio sp.]|uniref:hypothetical protein n=1 Tax=Cellvibrio sp. TaxID=1965322 RepID=UPI0031A842E3